MAEEESPQPRRLLLQSLLKTTAELDSVYFQPPSNLVMQYPCIVYRLDGEDVAHADNRKYRRAMEYEVTVIDEDPDSSIPAKISDLQYSRFVRRFSVDNLYHTVFTLFF